MARIRTIKPELPQSQSMGNISREARLCFILLFTLSDDHGKLRGSSRMLASLLYPYDDDAPSLIDVWLSELEREGCILRYQIDGTHYLKIMNWLGHQKVDRPTASKIPEPREGSTNDREDSRGLVLGSRIKDQGSEERIDDVARVRTREDFAPLPPARPRAVPPPLSEEHQRVRGHICQRLVHLATRPSPEIDTWLEAGCDVDLDILPVVDELVAKMRGDIGSFKFFTAQVMARKDARMEQEEQFQRAMEKFK